MGFDPSSRADIERAGVILIATVESEPDDEMVILRPEAYLKGSAEGRSFALRRSSVSEMAQRECPLAGLSQGDRVLLVLHEEQGQLAWPAAAFAFYLRDGTALSPTHSLQALPENELVDQIRSITGQYVVPAADEATFSIQGRNLVIVTGALVVVFALGLLLMRVWHRIDPT